MRIAIFHHIIGAESAIGKILEELVRGLSKEVNCVTVYGSELSEHLEKNEKVHLVKIPSIKRPLFLLFLTYHMFSIIRYWFDYLKGKRYDVIIGVESNFIFLNISYVHFCHTAYLKNEWHKGNTSGLLRILRWLNHKFRALLEPWIFRRASCIVVPSYGLKREIEDTFPFVRYKVKVISNFIDWERMQSPTDFDRSSLRKRLGFNSNDIIVAFTALGNFEHKGLPLLLQALDKVSCNFLKLLIIGGKLHEIRRWEKQVKKIGLEDRVWFIGFQKDIRPYLWIADLFVFPSTKEIFPLAVIEAAAAGLPLIVTPLYGVEEFMQDGEMGYVVDRSVDSIIVSLEKFISLPPGERMNMARRIKHAVKRYTPEVFVQKWLKMLSNIKT